jgi:hypothetical protein
MGTGAVALVAGVGIGYWASRTASQEKSSTDPSEKPSLRDAAYGRAIGADVTMAAGVLLIGAGLVLRFTAHAPTSPSPTAIRVGPSGVSAEWKLDL